MSNPNGTSRYNVRRQEPNAQGDCTACWRSFGGSESGAGLLFGVVVCSVWFCFVSFGFVFIWFGLVWFCLLKIYNIDMFYCFFLHS